MFLLPCFYVLIFSCFMGSCQCLRSFSPAHVLGHWRFMSFLVHKDACIQMWKEERRMYNLDVSLVNNLSLFDIFCFHGWGRKPLASYVIVDRQCLDMSVMGCMRAWFTDRQRTFRSHAYAYSPSHHSLADGHGWWKAFSETCAQRAIEWLSSFTDTVLGVV